MALPSAVQQPLFFIWAAVIVHLPFFMHLEQSFMAVFVPFGDLQAVLSPSQALAADAAKKPSVTRRMRVRMEVIIGVLKFGCVGCIFEQAPFSIRSGAG